MEKRSKNTYENALYSSELIRKKGLKNKVLLSTSAMHMPRSIACFKKQGLEVVPFTVDESSAVEPGYFIGKLIPDAQILLKWYRLMHEWVGINVYRVQGYC